MKYLHIIHIDSERDYLATMQSGATWRGEKGGIHIDKIQQ